MPTSVQVSVVGTDIIRKKLKVLYQGKGIEVDAYAFQLQSGTVPKNINVFVGRDSDGRLLLKQDSSSVLDTLFEEECTYKFKISGVMKDSKSHSSYLSLKDEYGLSHRLYNPNAKGLAGVGRIIDCTVDKMEDGHLVLSSPMYQTIGDVQVIDSVSSISPDEYRLFEILHEKRVNQYASMNDHSMRGVWSSVIDKYPDSAHFIYELLQNADDAEASEVTVILDKDALYFKHNGRIQFTVTDDYDESITPGHINAIVAIGDSTKGKNGQQKIGKFGVGFKAVFDYTDIPVIYTDTFKFKIENYIVPELVNYDNPHREKGETLFEIPFKNPERAYDEIRQKLQNLKNPILFLNHIRKVIWKDAAQFHHEKEYSKTIVSQITKGDVICQKVYEHTPSGVKKLWLFSRTVTLGERGKWPVSVGFFLSSIDKRETIDTSETQKVYCFFPTLETFGTCFISHAPFLLVDNRQLIKRNEDINKTLQKAIVSLSCDSLPILRDIGIETNSFLIDGNILQIIPQKKSHYYNAPEEKEDLFSNEILYNPFLSLLKKEALYLTKEGSYLPASGIRLSQPLSLSSLLSHEQLQSLWGTDDTDIDFLKDAPTTKETREWKFLSEEVGIKVISTSDFARKLTSDFMKEQPMEWVLKLYSFLSQDARDSFLPRYEKQQSQSMPFRYAPIVKTDKGEWISPYRGDAINIFFDDSSGSEYNVVAKEYFLNERAKKFLVELGVKEPEMGDFIKSKVLSKYKSDETIYVNDVINDFHLIYQYSLKVPRNEYDEYISEVKSSYKFLCIDGKTENLIHCPQEIYYPTKELKQYFGHFSDTVPASGYSLSPFYPKRIKFLDEKSYGQVFKNIETQKLHDFLRALGIRFSPFPEKVDRVARYELSNNQKDDLSASSYRYNDYEYGEDYRVEGLRYALENNLTHGMSVLLWKWLCAWKTDECSILTFYFHYHKYIPHTCDASYVDILKHTPWIYVNRRTVKAPDELYVEDMLTLTSDYPYSASIMSLLDIKKKTDSLEGLDEDLVGTFKKGQMWEDILKKSGLSEKEARKILEKAGEEKRAREKRNKQNENNVSSQRSGRKEMADYSSSDTFGDSNEQIISSPANGQKSSSVNPTDVASNSSMSDIRSTNVSEKIDEIKRRHQEDQDREIKEEVIRYDVGQIVASGGKYTKEWFEKLLELENIREGDNIETFGRKSITLSFSRVEKELESDRIYILKNSSSIVPLEVEQVGGLEVQFSFYKDMDDITFGFEVASVKDFTLRLKAKNIDSDKLKEIDWSLCTKATVQINNPVALIKKLSESFKNLGLETGLNLKDSLGDNISFVFGPPGTGKTTHLAARITDLINDNEQCRILVLTPTNKACDVIANKIADISDARQWMCRFLTTGSERLENDGYVCDKNSDVYQQDKCCIITTTARLPYDGFGIGYDGVLLNEIEWDYVIIDEASMIPLAHVVYAIYRFPSSKIIIAGDPMQIMPIVREEAWKNENIYTMVNLNRFDNPKTEPRPFEILNLTTQYRSVPAIGRLFSEFAYQGRLHHNRTADSVKPISIKNFEDIKPVNFITFKVDKYDNISGAKKLSSSHVHIYSVLLVAEMCQYFAKQFEKSSKKSILKIGVICPYAAQAQLIEKLLEQSSELPDNVEITTGTIHGFQGDECDMIFAVFNPPKGLKYAPDRVLVNNANILNVAISRARDYLFILMPQKDTDGFENLKGIIRIGRIAIKDRETMTFMNAYSIEERLFKERGHIENNTFVTTHQMTNIYSSPVSKYEVRIDDSSVDIQIAPR